jgi:biotin carboxyl carrier protein
LKLKITVDGKVFEVEVDVLEPEQRQPAYVPPLSQAQARVPAPLPVTGPPAQAGGAAVVNESKVCRSPISGVVVRVSAQVGQSIQVNDVLMVLEAMKMETVITSPIAGKITKVNAAQGDAVPAGQILVEFE